ncbi:MAG TPA: PBP1A family penicillin-binding protein [Candidatus Acidoferrales bacterium]|nr:PBP1A family penicillin-binding protein [Candidatus Acidoferrales bacterium]
MIKRRRQRRRVTAFFLRLLVAILVVTVFAPLGIIAGVIYAYSRDLPDINKMADFQPLRSTQVYARDGTLLASLYRENRIWVPLDHVPNVVRNAFIATEDARFYVHHGIDLGGIARAAWADYHHEQLQGASTITQQLARALFLSDEVSISRKIQEALLAMEIERFYTKDEILERYLNLIYLGSGAYGVQAASHTYFGTDVANLTLAQAAILAGLPAAPSDYSPYVSFDRAKARQAHVLDRMVAAGFITQEQADQAKVAPLHLIGERPVGLTGYRYPYFTTYVAHLLEEQFGEKAVYEGGLEVDTTLDPRLQQLAEEAVNWGVGRAAIEGINAHQAALVAIRPSTGEILAMVGGAGGFSLTNQFNRAWQARRQPGSSFKAYVYTAAIDSGMTPTTTIDDSPVSYPMGDGTMWSPHDDDNRYFGPITLRYALAQSRNVVAVKLAEQLGVDRIIEYARRMGVQEPLDADLSLAIGTSVVTPLDQAAGYATLANQGIHIDPSPLRVVKDSFGSLIVDNRFPVQTEVVSAGTAYIVTTMLESVIQEGTGYPNAVIDRPAAGKTGTTSDYRDAWFVGYTPDLVTAVWLGNDDYSKMNESYGGNIPARIWARFMKAALANTPKHDFVYPSTEIVRLPTCGDADRVEFFLEGTEPASRCASGTGLYEPKMALAARATPAPTAMAGLSSPAPAAAVGAAVAAPAEPTVEIVTPIPLPSDEETPEPADDDATP